jgi:hypothetical protein
MSNQANFQPAVVPGQARPATPAGTHRAPEALQTIMPGPPEFDRDLALAAVAEGTRRYFAERRSRVRPFVRRHFTLSGTLALHRVALGWDIARAPLNLFLAVPQIILRLAAASARRLGAPGLASKLPTDLLLTTDVVRQITWLIDTELLELPATGKQGVSHRDRLAETILATPMLGEAIESALAELGRRGDDPAFRDRLNRAMVEYTISRAAAAEITTGLASLGAGALVLNKITPGAATLGPALAALVAQQSAAAHFPLGPRLGRLWYGYFPPTAPASLVAMLTICLMLAAASLAAFAGVISDPIQAALGLHRARLMRLIDALERQLSDPKSRGFAVHDHYVARLLDVFDLIASALRLAH